MLFVNDELEENQPIFSEPKKVHPATEDEMARRIKNMLGEYITEDDNKNYDFEDVNINAQSDPSTNFTDANSLKSKIPEEDTFNSEVDCENKDKEPFLEENGIVSKNETEMHDDNAEVEAGGIKSRRSSLKRQCKEKISLLDYNPMFTIRNKRTKTSSNSSSQKPKNTKYAEDKCSNGHSGSSTTSDFPSDITGSVERLMNCVSDNDKCSEYPKFDSFSNDELDEPPLLDPVTSDKISHGKDLENADDKDQEFIENFEDESNTSSVDQNNFEDFGSNENFNSQLPINVQMKAKSRKQSKKKKKKLYESSSLAEVDTGSTSQNGSNIAQTPEPAVGACQIKNGIIKIRLSKLIDNKKDIGDNDYEVTLCESDALIGCKKLSVPLSPLAPAVYSAYCENLKIKKKNHSKKIKKERQKEWYA